MARVVLFVRSGGRCEFPSCNEYLLRHPRTHSVTNFADMAHIYAFSEQGPRGKTRGRPDRVNAPENLLVLCKRDHREIDQHPGKYTVPILKEYKRKHEDRIHHLTGLTEESETYVVQLKSRISGKVVAIPADEVVRAVAPRYPKDTRGCVVDLTTIDATGPAFIETARQTIDRDLANLFSRGMDGDALRHLSVFALAPIPLLVYFGSKLSDKVAADFYQFHRSPKGWKWKKKVPPVTYRTQVIQRSSDPAKVALVLSLSGKVRRQTLPPQIQDSFTVYEISLQGLTPNPNFLRSREDLEGFRTEYMEFVSSVVANHQSAAEIHLFPACPAPVALACGHDLLHKAHPGLVVYDFDKARGTFEEQLRVNTAP